MTTHKVPMLAYSNDPARLADLRTRAAYRLTGVNGATVRATDALAVLHALASDPTTAADALTLLHELQVHQIELDLQAEELRESRVDLEAALRRQTELYDFQPVGCFTIDARFVVHELNHAGAAMLGVEREDAYGMGLDSFLSLDSRPQLKALVSKHAADGQVGPCQLLLCSKDMPDRLATAHISADPAGPRYFVALTSSAEPKASSRPGAAPPA